MNLLKEELRQAENDNAEDRITGLEMRLLEIECLDWEIVQARYQQLVRRKAELDTVDRAYDYDYDAGASQWGMHWLDACGLYEDLCDWLDVPYDERHDWSDVAVEDLSPIEDLFLTTETKFQTTNWKKEGF